MYIVRGNDYLSYFVSCLFMAIVLLCIWDCYMYLQLYAELYYCTMLIGWLVFHLGTFITPLLGWTYNLFFPSTDNSEPVGAWKFAGSNSKGFSPINVPNQLVDCLVQGIHPVCGPATVGQVTKTKAFTGCGPVHRIFLYFLNNV